MENLYIMILILNISNQQTISISSISSNLVTLTNSSTSAIIRSKNPPVCSQFNVNTDLILSSSIVNNLKQSAIYSFTSFRATLIEFLKKFDALVFLQNYKSLLQYLIPMGFILLASLISFIFFIICCTISICQNRENDTNKKNFKRWFITSLIISILLIPGLIFFFFYLKKFVLSVKLINCSLGRIPYNLFNGIPRNNTQNIVYLGLNALNMSLNTLKTNISQLQNVSGNFNNILRQNLSQKSTLALNQYNTSINSLNSETAYNPQKRTNEKPLIIQNSLNIFTPVKSEIDALNVISISINTTAGLVTNIFSSDTTEGINSILQYAETQITSLANDITSVFDALNVNELEFYFNIIVYTTLSFCIFIIILIIINMVLAYWIHYKGIFKIIFLPSFLTMILSFFNLILSILTIGFFAIFLLTSIFCSTYNDFLNGNFPQIEALIVSKPNNFVDKLLKTCIYSTGSGNLNSIIPIDTSSQLNQVNNIIDGIFTIGNRINEFNRSSSQSIPVILSQLKENKNQIKNDFASVIPTLQQWNNLNCANTVAFTSESCGTGNTCFLISTLSEVDFASQGNCSNQTQAIWLFRNLKRYYDTDTIVLNNITTQLGLINTRINEIYSSFGLVNNDLIGIRNTLSSFINGLKFFTGGLFDSLDCRVLNYSLREFETSVCFNLSYYSFPLFMVLIITSYLLWILNYSILFLFNNIKYNRKNNNNN